MAEDLDGSFDSKEDYELYRRLMNERQKIQNKEEKRRQTKALKAKPIQSDSLEERERGFQLHFAGANEDRLKQANRRQRTMQEPSQMRSKSKEWQVRTVELQGKDGVLHRLSPHDAGPSEAAPEGVAQEVDEDLQQLDEASRPSTGGSNAGIDQASRPSTGGSNSGLDQDTRGVLHIMNAANQEQLSWLRESLSSQIAHRVPRAGSGLPPQPKASGRPSSSCSRSAIADAIQAENERVKKMSETLEQQAMGVSSGRPSGISGDFTSGGSRPSSRSSRSRLPLGPEEAAQVAPPSVLSSKASPETAAAGYPGKPAPSLPAAPVPPTAPQVTSASPGLRNVPDELFDRVSRLDQKKQKALLKVLESLEAEQDSPASQEASARAIIVRVLSNWGDRRQCGLSLMEALDSSAQVLTIPPAAISLCGAQGGSTTLARVVQGRLHSSTKSVWSASVRQTQSGFEPFDIELHLPRSSHVAALRLWNFNQPEGLTKGVREVEVWHGDSRLWTGVLPMGTGAASPPVVVPLVSGFQALTEQLQERPICEHSSESLAMRQSQGTADTFANATQCRAEEDQEELLQSLQALEVFRSSQSRRFFSARQPDAEELNLVEHEHAAPAPTPIPLSETAQFGLPDNHDFLSEAAAMGLEIPLRNFNDTDALDGLMSTEPRTLGSSLMAGQLEQNVVIPTLPRGRQLVFNCVSTWGDKDFVGLAGIEIFDGRGFPVILKDVSRQVTADPHSINVLREYDCDPRTPDKLFDQVNLTRDDLHVWLAPFSAGRPHTITVDLEHETEISMIRVWNYNKSRLHSSRGVRDLEILLDGSPLFTGEVRRAPGVLTEPEEACELILFTQDESVLEGIAEHDWLPAHLPIDSDEDLEDEVKAADMHDWNGRPPTADFHASCLPASPRGQKTPRTGMDGRPMTRATERQRARGSVCSSISITVHSTWGDPYYVGLTALEVLDGSLRPIPAHEVQLDAAPRDLNDLEGVDGDLRVLDNILDGVGCTTDDRHMWLAPFLKVPGKPCGEGVESQQNRIRIGFTNSREVAGFNVWNYNKNAEDTCRGIREFSVHCDDRYIASFLCRKAPGHVHFDFKQLVLLDQPPSDSMPRSAHAAPGLPRYGSSESRPPSRGRPPSGLDRSQLPQQQNASRMADRSASPHLDVRQQYETPLHPCGFVFKFMFVSTWSDVHYVGLDGIEICNMAGRPLRPKRAYSNFGSVRDLPGMEADVRTEDALLRGAPESGRMWLAPFSRHPANFVELVFDEPNQISAIKFWNYSRTPSRGVRDVEVYVDDLLIYQGILRQASRQARGEVVLFTDQNAIVERERSLIYQPSPEELVAFFDESGQWDQRTGSHIPGTSQPERPMTALTA